MKLLNLNVCIKMDNFNEVKKLINAENPDFCTFQEVINAVDRSCYEMYKFKNKLAKLKNYPYNEFAPIYVTKQITCNGEIERDFGGRAEQGSMILSKHVIVEHKNQFYYNEYRYSYDMTYFRQKDWCRSIQNSIVKVNGQDIQIINVHGVWNKDKTDDDRTIAQSKFILSQVRKDLPCILVGDFNSQPTTKSIKMLDKKFRNLIKEYKITRTRPTFDDGLDVGDIVCDYVFVNDKVKVNNFKVDENAVSDHLALVLDFDIKD